MVNINFSKADADILRTVLAALKRGQWKLEGDEVLAFSQAFQWASKLSAALDHVMSAKENKAGEKSAEKSVSPAVEVAAEEKPAEASEPLPKRKRRVNTRESG